MFKRIKQDPRIIRRVLPDTIYKIYKYLKKHLNKMKFKDLIILDVQKFREQERDCNYINLSSGSINFTNSKRF